MVDRAGVQVWRYDVVALANTRVETGFGGFQNPGVM